MSATPTANEHVDVTESAVAMGDAEFIY